jgi:hypothetical protein
VHSGASRSVLPDWRAIEAYICGYRVVATDMKGLVASYAGPVPDKRLPVLEARSNVRGDSIVVDGLRTRINFGNILGNNYA